LKKTLLIDEPFRASRVVRRFSADVNSPEHEMEKQNESVGIQPSPASEGQTGTRCAPKRVVRNFCGLSFWTITETTAGRRVSENEFDVPLQVGVSGFHTGNAVAFELMFAIKSGVLPGAHASAVIGAAYAAASEQSSSKTPSRKNAAISFLWAVESMFLFAVRAADFEDYIERKTAELIATENFYGALAVKHKAAFVPRMKAAKARKAALRSAGGAV